MTTTTDYDPFAIFGDDVEISDRMWEQFLAAATTPAPVEPTPVIRCQGCGRPLKSKISIARGYGSECWRKAHRRDRIAALSVGYTDRQVEDAIETIELGGAVRLRGRIFLIVGHNGDVYRATTTGQCHCRAGLASKTCFHTLTAKLAA